MALHGMKKIQLGLVCLALLSLPGVANSAPYSLRLVKHNRIATSTVGTQVWRTCPPPAPPETYAAPCINPDNSWVVANGVTGSNATWTWDPVTGVLASTGLFWSTTHIGSNPSALTVTSDRVENLTIDTVNQVTMATRYDCVEGNFLSAVNANGCGTYDLGLNAVDDSSIVYNADVGAGPDPYCVRVVLGGDDIAYGNPRGVRNTSGGTPGCDPTDGAFTQYTVLKDETATGGELVLSNGIPIACPAPLPSNCAAGANWLTFAVAGIAVSDSVAPAGDLAVPFGAVAFGATATETVTVVNVGAEDLVLGQIGAADGLAAPFGILNDTCSGVTLAPAGTCTLDVRFQPVTADVVRETFDIPSSDAGYPTLAFSLSGSGKSPGMPDPFVLVDQAGVPVATPVTSEAVTISGISVAVSISVSGAASSAYSINGGAFTSTPGTVSNGSTVRVRHTSAPVPETAESTLLVVGGVADTFTSTTSKYAVDDVVTTPMGVPVEIDVLQNDLAFPAPVYAGIWDYPQHGTAVESGSPGPQSGIRITYTPNPGYTGPDSFEYWVEGGVVADYGVVTITVVDADGDGDGVPDSLDNCTGKANADQVDADGDDYGNICDADLDNSGQVTAADYAILRSVLNQTAGSSPTAAAADLNGSGAVTAADYAILRASLNAPPGPSGRHP